MSGLAFWLSVRFRSITDTVGEFGARLSGWPFDRVYTMLSIV